MENGTSEGERKKEKRKRKTDENGHATDPSATAKKKKDAKRGLDAPQTYEDIVKEVMDIAAGDRDAVLDGIDALRLLRKRIVDAKDDVNDAELVSKCPLNRKLVVSLLPVYNASLDTLDMLIFEILQLLESQCSFRMQAISPVVWGSQAREYYAKLLTLGESLHQKLTPNQAIEWFDKERVWFTALHLSTHPTDSGDVYDVRFVLMFLANLLHPASDLSSLLVVKSNLLSLVFAACSSSDPGTRGLAYFVLQRYHAHMQELTLESFHEKPLLSFAIRQLRNSCGHENQRLPHAVSLFYAYLAKLSITPLNPIFAPIWSAVLLRPTVPLDQVPELYKLLQSAATTKLPESENAKDNSTSAKGKRHDEHQAQAAVERQWILQLVLDSSVQPHDYQVLQSRYGVKLLCSLFGAKWADTHSRSLVLLVLKKLASMPSIANDLNSRMSLTTWLSAVSQNESLTRWERIFLLDIATVLSKRAASTRRGQEAGSNSALAAEEVARTTGRLAALGLIRSSVDMAALPSASGFLAEIDAALSSIANTE